MYWKRWLCALLTIFVVALVLCPVSAGQGPFSAAFGPATKFKALQVLLLLMLFMAAALIEQAAALSASSIVSRDSASIAGSRPFVMDALAVGSSLRC